MRIEGEEEGALRSQPPEPPGRPVPGTYYPRICICPACGSKTTILRGTSRGIRYMLCRRCGHPFKAASG